MKKILAIGNSFSEDATKFLHPLAESAGVDTKVVNLYVGGCSLEKHWAHIQQHAAPYQVQINGTITERHASIQEMLAEEDWDFIVTQQASHDSGWPDTYEPFLGDLVQYLHEKVPQAEVLLMETWAYEQDSDHWAFPRYHRDQVEMLRRLSKAYRDAAARHGLRLIPCGDVIQAVRGLPEFNVSNGGMSLCRDGFHMHFLYGRYLLACVWAWVLLDIDPAQTDYLPTSLGVLERPGPDIIQTLKRFVSMYCGIHFSRHTT